MLGEIASILLPHPNDSSDRLHIVAIAPALRVHVANVLRDRSLVFLKALDSLDDRFQLFVAIVSRLDHLLPRCFVMLQERGELLMFHTKHNLQDALALLGMAVSRPSAWG